ncbi:MAG: alpha/beta hydrolase [Flavipsychrobacter sp.]|nr:alpha/beta hydrolase [Flavipsychrobacter sp.]
MRNVVLLLVLLCFSVSGYGQLYSKAFGKKSDPAIIFLHGGPGYNCVNFELTTAAKLAESGYYVIVYDQRGCARSKEMKDSKYTMEEALNDLKSVYETHKVKKAVLVGHSWGGTLGTYFAASEPQLVSRVILVGSPYSYPMTIRSIVSNSERAYRAKDDTTSIKFIAQIKAMDTASLQYSSLAFMQAMRAGLYTTQKQTEEAKALAASLREAPEAKYLRASEFPPVQGLYTNEKYTTIHIGAKMKEARAKGVNFYGIYGDEDGLYDQEQLDLLRKELGEEHFRVIKGASHNVFIDKQPEFLQAVKEYTK